MIQISTFLDKVRVFKFKLALFFGEIILFCYLISGLNVFSFTSNYGSPHIQYVFIDFKIKKNELKHQFSIFITKKF